MYILFKATSSDKLGIVQTVGRILHLTVGFIPNTHVDIIEYAHLKPIILDEKVALAWKFFSLNREYINVRAGTLQNDQLQIAESAEAADQKVRYYLTDEDKVNATEFMKAVMRLLLDDVYDKRLMQANLEVSGLESSTWKQQEQEARAYVADSSSNVPMLTLLAAAREITISEMAAKVLAAVDKYNSTIAQLLANKQAVEREIKLCQSIHDCNKLLHMRFDIAMSPIKAAEEGLPTSATFNL